MSNNFKGNKPKEPKLIVFNQLRKNTKFKHPITEEIFYCNFKDEECVAYGASSVLTTNYVRPSDEEWNIQVELA